MHVKHQLPTIQQLSSSGLLDSQGLYTLLSQKLGIIAYMDAVMCAKFMKINIYLATHYIIWR